MPIISVTNQKGGVGKTTLIASLAQILTEKGYKVLSLNLDPQRNLDMMAGKGVAIKIDDKDTPSMLQVMNGECDIQDAIIKTPLGDLVRASSLLSGWTGQSLLTMSEYVQMQNDPAMLLSYLRDKYDKFGHISEQHVLRERLKEISKNYHYVLLDTNPSLMILTMNALCAADYVLIPAFCDDFSRAAIIELWNTIQLLNYYEPERELKVAGIVVTKSSKRTIVAQSYYDNFEERAKKMNTILFKTKIRQSVLANEATTAGQTVVDYASGKDIARDYRAFAKEFVKRIDELEGGKRHA